MNTQSANQEAREIYNATINELLPKLRHQFENDSRDVYLSAKTAITFPPVKLCVAKQLRTLIHNETSFRMNMYASGRRLKNVFRIENVKHDITIKAFFVGENPLYLFVNEIRPL